MFRRKLAARFFIGYAALVFYLCLFPWTTKEGEPGPWFVWNWPGGRTGFADVVLNFGFFVPLGVSGAFAFTGRWRAASALSFSVAISLLAEYLQGWIPSRVSSAADLVSNVSGTVFGLMAAPLMARLLHKEGHWLQAARVQTSAAALLACFVAGETFPFLPNYRLPHLRQAFHALGDASDFWQLPGVFLVFLTATYLARMVLLASDGKWPVLALTGFLLLRPLFVAVPFTGAEWISASAGVVAGAFPPPLPLQRTLFFLLPLGVIVEQLRPFAFVPTPQPFEWVPLAAFFSIAPTVAIRYFAAKLFLYGATLYFLVRGGLSRLGALAVVLAILAAGEALQQYLPGRTPETTDLFLAMAACAMLAATSRNAAATERANHEQRPKGTFTGAGGN
ncbi:MAG: VanZ family protein [Bryobacterales bacterium]|nr:VanZ family protein [Bryobacterales bacterium]